MQPSLGEHFTDLGLFIIAALLVVIASELLVWLLLGLLARTRLYTPTGPLHERMGRLVFLSTLGAVALAVVTAMVFWIIMPVLTDGSSVERPIWMD